MGCQAGGQPAAEQRPAHPDDHRRDLHSRRKPELSETRLHYQHPVPDGGLSARRIGDRRLHRAHRHRPVRRPYRGPDRLHLGLPAPERRQPGQQDVAGDRHPAHLGGHPCGHAHRRGLRSLQRLLCGQVQAPSLHRHPGHPAHRLHPAAALRADGQQQGHGHLQSGRQLYRLCQGRALPRGRHPGAPVCALRRYPDAHHVVHLE